MKPYFSYDKAFNHIDKKNYLQIVIRNTYVKFHHHRSSGYEEKDLDKQTHGLKNEWMDKHTTDSVKTKSPLPSAAYKKFLNIQSSRLTDIAALCTVKTIVYFGQNMFFSQ